MKYKYFHDKRDANSFGSQVGKFTDDEEGSGIIQRRTLDDYIENTHWHINSYLRRKDWKGSNMEHEVIALDSLMETNIVPENIVVYRGVDMDFAKTLKPGRVFVDKGFVSTSLREETILNASFDSILTIRVPKGTLAFYVGPRSGNHPNEYELLLARGLTYKVLKNDGYDIILTVVR